MSNRLDQLFESSVNIAEVIAEETQIREPAPFVPEVQEENTFHESAKPEAAAVRVETEEEEPEEEYDAERNARSLVYGINAVRQPIYTGAAMIKLHQMVGGSETKKKWREVQQKMFKGEELSEQEQKMLVGMEKYEMKKNQLSEAILPNEKRTEHQIKAAIAYCEETKITVNTGLAFWGMIAGDTVEDITRILIA